MSVYDFKTFKNSPFGESISYTPSGDVSKTINAVVFRQGPKQISAQRGGEVQYYPLTIEIDRSDIATVTENEDKITCPDVNGASKTYRVSKILASDEGCFKLGLGI